MTHKGAQGSDYIATDCATKKAEEFKSGAVTELLNAGMIPSGFHYVSAEGGFPVLAVGNPEVPEGTVNWAVLDTAIAKAEKLSQKDYTQPTWAVLSAAVEAGRQLKEAGTKDQAEIDNAAQAIETAIKDLKKRDPYKPVQIPQDAVKISSQADFAQIKDAKDKYYVLTQDIVIDGTYKNFSAFGGVLDGQGLSLIHI